MQASQILGTALVLSLDRSPVVALTVTAAIVACARLLSGERAAYRYLPDSIGRFPRPPQMFQLMAGAGFEQCAWDGYFMHAAGLYRGIKP